MRSGSSLTSPLRHENLINIELYRIESRLHVERSYALTRTVGIP